VTVQGAPSAEQGDRLFFALWPDADLLEHLTARLPSLGVAADARLQRPDQWHITLEFLGQVPGPRQALLHEVATEAIAGAAPFTVRFDRLEHWRKPQVLCLAAGHVPPAMMQLVSGLRSALARRDFTPEAREFRPHLTLARKVRRAPGGPFTPAIEWPADAIVLVRSVPSPAGSRYEPLARWNVARAAR
jgi:2'-5' RNA ligase